MTDDDRPTTTLPQDEWVTLAAAAREQLRGRVPEMKAMEPGELAAFMDAMNTAYWLEIRASNFDAEQESQNRSLTIG